MARDAKGEPRMKQVQMRRRAYLPVTTLGAGAHSSVDEVVIPFLGRFVDMAMVSFHYARLRKMVPSTALFVDSGGFACLRDGSQIIEREDGLAEIHVSSCDEGQDVAEGAGAGPLEVVSPEAVMAVQRSLGTFGATLDFPIPPHLALVPPERERRLMLTLRNAAWAFKQPRFVDRLFASVQGWDEPSYADCARQMVALGAHDLAVGGLVPRMGKWDDVLSICETVAKFVPPGGLLHAFGVGDPDKARELFEMGFTSVDSSSYVRSAIGGLAWGTSQEGEPKQGARDASTLECAHLALRNLDFAIAKTGADNGRR